MIFDHLDNSTLYKLGPRWEQAFEYLKTLDKSTPDGEYKLDGENLFAKVLSYETRAPELGNIESHRRYADIQICLEGAEGIDLFDSEQLTALDEYDSDKDLIFYQTAEPQARADIHPGYFIILWPRDAHRPQMAVGIERSIKKAVIKVAL